MERIAQKYNKDNEKKLKLSGKLRNSVQKEVLDNTP